MRARSRFEQLENSIYRAMRELRQLRKDRGEGANMTMIFRRRRSWPMACSRRVDDRSDADADASAPEKSARKRRQNDPDEACCADPWPTNPGKLPSRAMQRAPIRIPTPTPTHRNAIAQNEPPNAEFSEKRGRSMHHRPPIPISRPPHAASAPRQCLTPSTVKADSLDGLNSDLKASQGNRILLFLPRPVIWERD